jgi:drug/metabolite transporter (DMT)-like permease
VNVGPALAAASASFLTGAAVVVTRYVIEYVDPLPLALMRYTIAVCCLIGPIVWLRSDSLAWRERLAVMVLGTVFFGVFTYCFNVGLQTVPAARAGTLVSVMPALTLALAVGMRIEALTLAKISGVTVAIVGVAIVLNDADSSVGFVGALAPGDLWLLGAALCGAVYNVGTRRFLARADSITVAFWSMLGGVMFLSAVSAGTAQWPVPMSLGSGPAMAVVFLGTAAGALGFTLWIWALARSTPTQVSVFFTLNPISAAILAALMLGETASDTVLVGMAVVLIGIVLTSITPTLRHGEW